MQRLYPDARPELNFTNPYETLLATMLSAQCTDKRVNMVTPKVFEDFPNAFEMAKTTPEHLYTYIKSCGFVSKSVNIVESCKIIAKEYDGAIPSTMEELIKLPGVGRKTANVVLANAFHVPAIAVDTHVFVVANRLGLSDAKNVEETEKQLMRAIPKEKWNDTHHYLIYHGRRVCKKRNPECAQCTLNVYCKYYNTQL